MRKVIRSAAVAALLLSGAAAVASLFSEYKAMAVVATSLGLGAMLLGLADIKLRGPRRVTSRTKIRLVASIQASGMFEDVYLFSAKATGEAVWFREQIASIFRSAGLFVKESRQAVMALDKEGLWLYVHPDLRGSAEAISRAFHENGLPVEGVEMISPALLPPEMRFVVVIGTKPSP